MNKHALTINLMLLAVIIAIGYFTFTTGMAQQQTRQKAEEMQEEVDALAESQKQIGPATQPASQPSTQPSTQPTIQVDDKRFPNFGTRNIFEILIPKPTPTPPPIVTPVPPPPLEQIFAQWTLSGVLGKTAIIQDAAVPDPIVLELNGAPHTLYVGAYQFNVTVVRTDDDKFEVDLKTDLHGDAVFTLKMFPNM